ncbi:MAG: hypothetical protein KDE56_00545 [Anaerolineales bacterium]|nr:hypothetical protein [Anaerolineales bacterium]
MEAGYFKYRYRKRNFRKGSTHASLVAFMAIFLALIAATALSLFFTDKILGVLTGLSLVLGIYPFLHYKKDPTLFAPPYVLSILLLISYPLRLITLLFFSEYAAIDQHAGLYVGNGTLMRETMGLIVLGQIGFLIGYYKTPNIFLQKVAEISYSFQGTLDTLARKAFFLSYAVWAIQLIRKFTGSGVTFSSLGANYSASTNQIFSWASDLYMFAAALAVVYLAGSHPKKGFDKLLALLALLPPFIQPLIIDPGGKTPLLNIIFVIIASIILAGRKMRLSYVIFSLAYLVFFVWPFVSSYRDLALSNGLNRNTTLSISQQAAISRVALQQAYSERQLDVMIGDFSRRFGAFDATLVTLARVPSTMQYTYFKDLALVPFVLVPRIIFPIKPVSITQQQYSVRVYGMTGGGSAAPFIIGEGYLNGGALGVPILTCAWGIMWAIFYRGFLVPRRKELVAIALYAALLTRFATSFEWALMSMIGLPSFLIVWAPAIYWCTLPGGKQISNRGSLESITDSP